MESSQLSSLSFWQKTGIVAFSPQAVCLTAFAYSLNYYEGDRLTAGIVAMALSMSPAVLYVLLLVRLSREAGISPRMNAFAAIYMSAIVVGLTALVSGLGWALIGELRERNGHYVLGGALALAFLVGTLALPVAFARRAFGLSAPYMAILCTCNAGIIAFSAYTASIGFCLTVAAGAGLTLLAVFLSIPRRKPDQAL